MVNTDVTKMAFFAVKDPKLITIDLAELNKQAAVTRAERDAANPPTPEPARIEYNRLRQRLYDLQQSAKNAEVLRNIKADAVTGLEERINVLLKKKKQAIAEGHLGDERVCEHQLAQLETELVDAKKEAAWAKESNARAARTLKAFDGHARMVELKLLLDTPLPEAKK